MSQVYFVRAPVYRFYLPRLLRVQKDNFWQIQTVVSVMSKRDGREVVYEVVPKLK
jgi:hypothetical protein